MEERYMPVKRVCTGKGGGGTICPVTVMQGPHLPQAGRQDLAGHHHAAQRALLPARRAGGGHVWVSHDVRNLPVTSLPEGPFTFTTDATQAQQQWAQSHALIMS